MSHYKWMFIASIVAGTAVIAALILFQKPAVAPTTNTANGNRSVSPTTTSTDTTAFSTVDLPDRDSHFSFSLNLPSAWAAEYVGASQAINFFDPGDTAADTNLAKSKIFVQYYQGEDWQPSTYDIKSAAATVDGQPARSYTYDVPPTVQFALAPGYPAWVVTANHHLIHIRTGAQAPYTFYIFHQAPDLADATFSDIVNSIKTNP